MAPRRAPRLRHRGDDSGEHACRGTDPARVGRTHDPGLRVGEQHWNAVGGEHGEPDAGLGGDHRVGGRVVGLPVLGRRAHHGHVRAVHLLQEHDRHTELTGQAGSVGGDRGGVVADSCGQVERVVDAAGSPARSGADDPPDARHTQLRSAQLLSAS